MEPVLGWYVFKRLSCRGGASAFLGRPYKHTPPPLSRGDSHKAPLFLFNKLKLTLHLRVKKMDN